MESLNRVPGQFVQGRIAESPRNFVAARLRKGMRAFVLTRRCYRPEDEGSHPVGRQEDDMSDKNLVVTIRDARPMDRAQLRRAVVEIQE